MGKGYFEGEGFGSDGAHDGSPAWAGEAAFEVFRYLEVSGFALRCEYDAALDAGESELPEIFSSDVPSSQVPGAVEQRERVGLDLPRGDLIARDGIVAEANPLAPGVDGMFGIAALCK